MMQYHHNGRERESVSVKEREREKYIYIANGFTTSSPALAPVSSSSKKAAGWGSTSTKELSCLLSWFDFNLSGCKCLALATPLYFHTLCTLIFLDRLLSPPLLLCIYDDCARFLLFRQFCSQLPFTS